MVLCRMGGVEKLGVDGVAGSREGNWDRGGQRDQEEGETSSYSSVYRDQKQHAVVVILGQVIFSV